MKGRLPRPWAFGPVTGRVAPRRSAASPSRQFPRPARHVCVNGDLFVSLQPLARHRERVVPAQSRDRRRCGAGAPGTFTASSHGAPAVRVMLRSAQVAGWPKRRCWPPAPACSRTRGGGRVGAALLRSSRHGVGAAAATVIEPVAAPGFHAYVAPPEGHQNRHGSAQVSTPRRRMAATVRVHRHRARCVSSGRGTCASSPSASPCSAARHRCALVGRTCSRRLTKFTGTRRAGAARGQVGEDGRLARQTRGRKVATSGPRR